MAFVNNVAMWGNKALNRISALAGQAKTYYSSPVMMRARATASAMAKSPYVLGGAGLGAAGGGYAGYRQGRDRGNTGIMSGARGAIGGAVGGGLVGAGAYGVMKAGGPRAAYGAAKRGMASGVARASRYGAGLMDRAASRISM